MQKKEIQNIIIKTDASDNRGENKLAFSQNSKGVYNLMEYSFYFKSDRHAIARAEKMLEAIDTILTKLNGTPGENPQAPRSPQAPNE